MSPMPMIVVDKGNVSIVNRSGARVLADCRYLEEIRIVAGPERGKVQQDWKPCYLSGLAVHPPTGRWAVAAVLMDGTVRMEVAGRDVVLPTDKAGRRKAGDFLILGDRNGVVAVTPGNTEMWTTDGTYRSQQPTAFTEDGARVLVNASNSSMCQWWSWSFGPRPGGLRVLPPGATDGNCNQLVPGEPRTVLKHQRDGIRIATLDPTGTKPWKVARALRQERRGMEMALVLGDTLVFYREGAQHPESGVCDESRPGTYRRIELSTSEERVWETLEGECYTKDFIMASARRRTVYYLKGKDPTDGGVRLFEYALDSGTPRELDIESLFGMLDISPDGQTLLLFTYRQGLVLYDVDSGSVVPVGGMSKDGTARLLAPR
ncbi:hypothetical protein [Corallococcus carmarthensis]|uniref:hypothetical protein n=1 Tax=Corallococcus carmarthensis TaxID=2316728 RepID=UPI00148B6D98|nr:hypothetical protein [Corallococcus carmarthensis]NOK16522.1 hypothetical protein [Corallococcus carmarthensis]